LQARAAEDDVRQRWAALSCQQTVLAGAPERFEQRTEEWLEACADEDGPQVGRAMDASPDYEPFWEPCRVGATNLPSNRDFTSDRTGIGDDGDIELDRPRSFNTSDRVLHWYPRDRDTGWSNRDGLIFPPSFNWLTTPCRWWPTMCFRNTSPINRRWNTCPPGRRCITVPNCGPCEQSGIRVQRPKHRDVLLLERWWRRCRRT